MAVSVKSTVKKAAPKKAAPKKAEVKATPEKKAAKKPVAKAPAKKAPEKKPVAKAPAAKASASAKPTADAAKDTKRVAPHVLRKAASSSAEYDPIDTAKAVAFGSSIAERMKLAAAAEEARQRDEDIKLARRPTTRAQGTQTEQFPETDLREFRKRLLAAREQAMNGVSRLRATGFNESDDHEADGGDGTNQTLRLQALGQVGSINRILQQIEEALHRIDDGTYGVCTSCGQLIRKPRLLNQPFVLTCMECQSEMERGLR